MFKSFVRTTGLLAALCAPAVAWCGLSLVTVVGDADFVGVGKASCGSFSDVPREKWQRIPLEGDQPIWLSVRSKLRLQNGTRECHGRYQFTPVSGVEYIVRQQENMKVCLIELFRVVPGQVPVKERFTAQDGDSCLGR